MPCFHCRFNQPSRDNRTQAAESNSGNGPLQKAANVRFLFACLFCHWAYSCGWAPAAERDLCCRLSEWSVRATASRGNILYLYYTVCVSNQLIECASLREGACFLQLCLRTQQRGRLNQLSLTLHVMHTCRIHFVKPT